jgi:photosystem II stability/assembly factor-like uncharacterized protein
MKRILMAVASIAASLLLFSSSTKAQPAQCPFNITVVSLPGGPHLSGFNWSGPIRPMNDPCVEGIQVDPTDENLWYVSGFNGLYITRNGGQTWTHPLNGSTGEHSLFISPQNPSEVYLGIGQKLFRSLNKGLTWTAVHTFVPFIRSLFVAPDGKVYVGPQWANQMPSGIFVSQDKGITWKLLPFGSNQPNLLCWDIERDSNDGTLYVSTEISNHPQPYHPPLFRSANAGMTWTDISGTLPWHVVAMELRPQDGYVYALTEGAGLYGSSNHGTTWIPPTVQLGPSDSLLMDKKIPKRLYGGRQKFNMVEGGAYVSVNAGLTFHEIGLKGVTVGGMSLNGNSTRLFATAYASGIYISKVPPNLP